MVISTDLATFLMTTAMPLVLPAMPQVLPKLPPLPPKRRSRSQELSTGARLTRAHRRGNIQPLPVKLARQVKYLHASARRRLIARLAEAA